jgi:ABC-type nitrate/sulfonate/bicarbonate transport system substrate-binding protein
MLTEDPLRDVAVFNNRFLDCIVAAPDVENADDLVGKSVAVSGLGGQSHAEVIVALAELGMSTEDIEISIVGGQDSRVAALQAGSVDAIPVDCVLVDELQSQGYNVLVRLPDAENQLVGANLTLKRDFQEANPNTTLALTAANLEAMAFLFNETQKAAEYFAAWAQVSQEDALAALENYKLVAQQDLRWSEEGYRNVQDILIEVNPAAAAVDVTESYTSEFLDKLNELGLYDELGICDQCPQP